MGELHALDPFEKIGAKYTQKFVIVYFITAFRIS